MLDKLNQLSESHGELKPGRGMITGVIALSLAILCFLGVLAFHFPQYLTTPQLRQSYNVDVMRLLLYWSLVVAGGIALFNIVFSRIRWLSLGTFLDHLFGTAVQSDRVWPAHYGVVGDYVPNGFWKQLLFPFTWKSGT